jgi:hypothetical protein
MYVYFKNYFLKFIHKQEVVTLTSTSISTATVEQVASISTAIVEQVTSIFTAIDGHFSELDEF